MKTIQKQNTVKVGDKVTITADKKIRAGEVFFETDIFYIVQFHNYKECFMKIDIENGIVEVEKLN